LENVRKYGRIESELITISSNNKQLSETFIDGEAFRDLKSRQKLLSAKKEEIKTKKAQVKKDLAADGAAAYFLSLGFSQKIIVFCIISSPLGLGPR